MQTPYSVKCRYPASRSLKYLLTITALVAAWSANADERDVFVLRNDGVAVLFSIEIADTAAERTQGLMHRAALCARSGMLFDFERATGVRMWMKNTLIPLDMVFAGDDGRISHIESDTVPYSESLIEAREPARYVLEINGSEARELGIATGDTLLIPSR